MSKIILILILALVGGYAYVIYSAIRNEALLPFLIASWGLMVTVVLGYQSRLWKLWKN